MPHWHRRRHPRIRHVIPTAVAMLQLGEGVGVALPIGGDQLEHHRTADLGSAAALPIGGGGVEGRRPADLGPAAALPIGGGRIEDHRTADLYLTEHDGELPPMIERRLPKHGDDGASRGTAAALFAAPHQECRPKRFAGLPVIPTFTNNVRYIAHGKGTNGRRQPEFRLRQTRTRSGSDSRRLFTLGSSAGLGMARGLHLPACRYQFSHHAPGPPRLSHPGKIMAQALRLHEGESIFEMLDP